MSLTDIKTDPVDELNRQEILGMLMREWLPRHVCDDIEKVVFDYSHERACKVVRVIFKNGGRSPLLHVEATGRSIVTPLRVLVDDAEFTNWQAHCCMVSGPKQDDG